MSNKKKQLQSNKGIALILILWVIVILEAVVGGFIYVSRLQTKIAGYQVETLKAFALARGGMEKGINYINNLKKTSLTTEAAPETFPMTLTAELGEGSYSVTLDNEEGKLNLNTCSREQLQQLLGNNGIEAHGNLLDFIFTWREKRGALDTLQELSLAGLNQANLAKLEDLATVYSNGKINVNSASPEVLQLLPGMTGDKIKEIVTFRLGIDNLAGTADDQFLDATNISGILGAPVLRVIRDSICYRGRFYKIAASGSLAKTTRQITAFLDYDASKQTVKIMYWKEK